MPWRSAARRWAQKNWKKQNFSRCLKPVKPHLNGKRIALFGSYGWGDGEWMRTWEESCAGLGCVFAADSVICSEAPDETAAAACKALGAALAA